MSEQIERQRKTIIQLVDDSPGITQTLLYRRTKSFAGERGAIVNELIASGLIVKRVTPTRGRHTTRYWPADSAASEPATTPIVEALKLAHQSLMVAVARVEAALQASQQQAHTRRDAVEYATADESHVETRVAI